ncbi:MAG: hypothetical protein ABI239_14655 [Aquihabitans sp.]
MSSSSGSRRKQQSRRRPNKPKPVDLWRPVPQLPDPAPIVVTTDPGMVLRSLGAPPLHGQGAQAERVFGLVAKTASATLATALAAAAGLLVSDDDH